MNVINKILILFLLFMAILSYGGCSANMSKYYSGLRSEIAENNYNAAAKLVDEQKDKYGGKNILMFYLDGAIVAHYGFDFEKSKTNFEAAKIIFDQNYTKSVSAGAASMFYNDSSMPYYGEDFERAYITVFQSLNYILQGNDNEAVVESRQADTLFKFFSSEKSSYTDDPFIRYFMGLVYENGGYLNDAYISYSLALEAYKKSKIKTNIPQDLINDAYTSALKLKMNDKASNIRKLYPSAKENIIPYGQGELIIIDYNGIIPEKIETVFELALFKAWAFVDINNVNNNDMRDFQTAKSIGISAFANDYIKVAFPKYKKVDNKVKSFIAQVKGISKNSYKASDLGEIAQETLDSQIAKIYAKTIARAAIKYIAGKQASAQVKKSSGDGFGLLTQIAANAYNSLSETADLRAWNTLPSNILMARLFLPQGKNTLAIQYIGANGIVIGSQSMTVDIKPNKKNFLILKTLQ